MKIGILSDSHDNLPQIERAVKLFNRLKVGFVLHAGDFVAPFSVAKLKALKCGWRGVLGNNDGEEKGLAEASEGRIGRGPLRLALEGRKITLTHNIDDISLNKEKAELVIYGHNHKAKIMKMGRKLLLNPGECGGWVKGKSTVAVVDLPTLSAKILKI